MFNRVFHRNCKAELFVLFWEKTAVFVYTNCNLLVFFVYCLYDLSITTPNLTRPLMAWFLFFLFSMRFVSVCESVLCDKYVSVAYVCVRHTRTLYMYFAPKKYTRSKRIEIYVADPVWFADLNGFQLKLGSWLELFLSQSQTILWIFVFLSKISHLTL